MCQLDARFGSGRLFFLGLGEEVDEVLLPDGGVGVGAVAAGGVGDGDEDEFGVGHLRDDFSGMPSSGGLMKSSAELIQRTGAVMVESLGAGL